MLIGALGAPFDLETTQGEVCFVNWRGRVGAGSAYQALTQVRVPDCLRAPLNAGPELQLIVKPLRLFGSEGPRHAPAVFPSSGAPLKLLAERQSVRLQGALGEAQLARRMRGFDLGFSMWLKSPQGRFRMVGSAKVTEGTREKSGQGDSNCFLSNFAGSRNRGAPRHFPPS